MPVKHKEGEQAKRVRELTREIWRLWKKGRPDAAPDPGVKSRENGIDSLG